MKALGSAQGPEETRRRRRPLRLVYVAGPGDVAGTYDHWRQSRDDPSQVSITYSSQFFDVCRDLGAEALVIASHPRRVTLVDGAIRIWHRPPRFASSRSALTFYLGQLCSSVYIMFCAIRFRADVVVHAGGSNLWFLMRLLPFFGVAVVPSLHCVLWPRSERAAGRVKGWIRSRDRAFWRRSAAAILCVSSDISAQVVSLTGADHAPIVEFLPTYRPGAFSSEPPPADGGQAFRVLFAGRIEPNKGVLDLLEIARRLAEAGRTEIEFDLCGTGSVLESLREQVARSALTRRFRLHGHCRQDVMHGLLSRCHVVIVPTTADFVEGFNKVVAEGVLAGRPVITSSVCPAIGYVRNAVVEVPPNDVDAYQAAILELCSNQKLYDAKRAACLSVRGQFYDPSRGWAAALRKALDSLDVPDTNSGNASASADAAWHSRSAPKPPLPP